MLSRAASAARLSSSRLASTAAAAGTNVVLVDGARIPFKLSQTDYFDMMAFDLARLALKGLLDRTAVDPALVDYVLMGNVIQEVKTSNLARESALAAGFPNTVPAHTVAQACISANQAIASGAEKIRAGVADVVVAGGAETFSDVPIRLSRNLRKRALQAPKAMKKGAPGVMKLLKGLKPGDLAPELPAIANFLTGEIMGHSSDRLAARWGVSRGDQDAFAVRSHHGAAKAHADGIYADELIPVNGSVEENGVRADSSMESMGKLRPAFVRPHGTHTAANSSFLTDGAAAVLLMSEARALELGFTPKAYLRDYTFAAVDPFEEMLLGPAYATSKVLNSAGLQLSDIDAFEMHEAFAGQVLSNVNALASDEFAKSSLGRTQKVGNVDMDKVNPHGGSLSLGHPFGATGARLIVTAANRLIREDGKYALLSACADSGIGHAMLLERYES